MAGWALAISALLIYIIRWAEMVAGLCQEAMAVDLYAMGTRAGAMEKLLALTGWRKKNIPKNLADCLDFFNFV